MNCRVFVEKKSDFDLEAKRLFTQIKETFVIEGLRNLRIFNIYDIFGIAASERDKAIKGIFSEIVTDSVVTGEMYTGSSKYFAVEYLPGQFDQRADSAMQCLNLLSDKNQNVTVTSGKLIMLVGNVSDEDLEKVKNYCINPIEMREKILDNFHLPKASDPIPVPIIDDFISFNEDEIINFIKTNSIAMTKEDILFIQKYFRDEEKRNPTETEIKVLDTYWSDHCRHTTFETKIKNIIFPKDDFGITMQDAFNKYLEDREFVHGERINEKNISLMDMATIAGKKMRKKGLLNDLEISNEINACSVHIDVDVNGKIEKWLLMFKNETHNHPTEIEPFGGASTCLGGAIRDPLSGRAYVYQAIRITGSANPLEKLEDTLEGKLPQRKITTGAAHGYSSYGNQIGLATGHVTEIYHEGYKAKRMEVGAVVGAVPLQWVRREEPTKGDIVILIGGKTGRDGCGGATGSSKEHNIESLTLSGSEVQKGNAPEERKIQRLFRKEKVTKLIKKCNDFGAGGVAVAIGELASGLDINLDVIPTKYQGLSGTELAISESQERMAVVVSPEDKDKFIEYANEENIEATVVAHVTDTNRLIINHNGKKIVDISRNFLDTSGVTQEIDIDIESIDINKNIFNKFDVTKSLEENWYSILEDLNVASQKGLVEMFDSTVGSSTVLMPFGGKYQMTPTDVSVQKIPVLNNDTNTASAITWGFNPTISSWSQYHGAEYAVIESLAKLVAIGCDYKKARLSFQEYFQKLGKDSKVWSKPFLALLGTLTAQKEFGTPAIGGKDSMSGTFNDIHVPPSLISFAVTTVNVDNVISPEFKNVDNYIYLVKHSRRKNNSPNYQQLRNNFDFITENIKNKKIISTMTLKNGGIAEALSKMTFGNRIGAKIDGLVEGLFEFGYGSFIIETKEKLEGENVYYLGKTISEYEIHISDKQISMKKAEERWLEKLNPVFPYKTEEALMINPVNLYENTRLFICKNKVAIPKVLITAFPGTNCEYDSAKVFNNEGANTEILLFRNLTQNYINDSIEKMEKEINNSQILMFPGGFSAGDEPDGSGKFIATVIANDRIKKAIYAFLKRDGLILGICNGFQALIKSGLLPYGVIGEVTEAEPTLTFNKIGRHVSQMVRTKIISNKSPWLLDMEPGTEHIIPVSHGEGRFFAKEDLLKKLLEKGQIATQYVDLSGNISTEFKYNPNGSSGAVEGLLSPDGRIFGKMGHSERNGEGLYKNIIGNKEQNIFKNGVKYFK
ncbi:phosphoribosylformylglycinamidine synthase [Fusobacterium sp. PH5-44]|uniref:phosphoribosylformylglycinamidine synthase n=1 Tax=unclassified Fusobacterium TaxID=2648384 RepID=UPI003D225718